MRNAGNGSKNAITSTATAAAAATQTSQGIDLSVVSLIVRHANAVEKAPRRVERDTFPTAESALEQEETRAPQIMHCAVTDVLI
jgi:hypothetical protein